MASLPTSFHLFCVDWKGFVWCFRVKKVFLEDITFWLIIGFIIYYLVNHVLNL